MPRGALSRLQNLLRIPTIDNTMEENIGGKNRRYSGGGAQFQKTVGGGTWQFERGHRNSTRKKKKKNERKRRRNERG